MKMKKLFVLFVCASLSAGFFTAYAQKQGKEPFMTRSFPASSITEVEAATSGGSLTLTGEAGSQAVVEVYVSRDSWSNEKIKQTLDENYTIDVKVTNGKLYVAAKQKKNIANWQQGLSISFKITVPKQVNSDLKTSGGSIRLSNLSGSQNFKTSGGSLGIENVSGNIVGATSGGSINVSGSKDNIDLRTSGGSMTAKDCSGTINLSTSGGSINLNNLNGTIHAATSGGSITANDINGTLTAGTSGGSVKLNNISGNVDAHTSGGSMEVRINSVSNSVKLSSSGNINLYLPTGTGYNLYVKGHPIETSGMKNFHGDSESRRIEGSTGNGGAEINIKSSQRVRLLFE